MAPIELDPIPDPAYPDGSVVGNFDGNGNPYETPELLHRPHAFALMHGDGGAKVAYGQLMWRVDSADFAFADNSDGTPVGKCTGAGQLRAIKGLDAVIPKLNSLSGDAMDPTTPSIYHQLDGYGDVYLYWRIEINESEIVTACWVEASGAASGETANDIDAVAVANTDHDRFNGIGGGDSQGIYRVKLGTVNVDAQVTQDISTDVYWSTVVLTRDQGS